jgi:hypothetical protein
MKSKKLCLVVILIILLLSTSIVLAEPGVSLRQVQWPPSSISRGSSSTVTAIIDNFSSRSQTVVATLQLTVPGYYTRTFQATNLINPGSPGGKIVIPFAIQQDWPKGNYKANVYVSGNNIGSAIIVY